MSRCRTWSSFSGGPKASQASSQPVVVQGRITQVVPARPKASQRSARNLCGLLWGSWGWRRFRRVHPTNPTTASQEPLGHERLVETDTERGLKAGLAAGAVDRGVGEGLSLSVELADQCGLCFDTSCPPGASTSAMARRPTDDAADRGAAAWSEEWVRCRRQCEREHCRWRPKGRLARGAALAAPHGDDCATGRRGDDPHAALLAVRGAHLQQVRRAARPGSTAQRAAHPASAIPWAISRDPERIVASPTRWTRSCRASVLEVPALRGGRAGRRTGHSSAMHTRQARCHL